MTRGGECGLRDGHGGKHRSPEGVAKKPEYNLRYNSTHRAERLAAHAKYNAEHRAERRAQYNRYNSEHKEERAQWQRDHPAVFVRVGRTKIYMGHQ
jgi:hypothetical protein